MIPAREAFVARIVERMPGCGVPNCLACVSNRREALAIVSAAMAAALRWIQSDDWTYAELERTIAALDADA